MASACGWAGGSSSRASPPRCDTSTQVSGFDLVDDESKPERRPNKHMPSPAEWTTKYNPAYAYYAYYMRVPLMDVCVWWLRGREGGGCTYETQAHTLALPLPTGEAGDVDHLVASFLLAENIAHGINLRKTPSLQYLYYISQVSMQ